MARNPSAALRASADTYISARIPNSHFANLELRRSYLYTAHGALTLHKYIIAHIAYTFQYFIPLPDRGESML